MPTKDLTKIQRYHDIRNQKDELVTIIDQDKENGLIYCFGSPSRMMPLNAEKVLKMMQKID